MRLADWKNPKTGERIYRLYISAEEMAKAYELMDEIDREIIYEASRIEATISDKLLGLELMARRLEQAEGKESLIPR
jgi:hypothetical protein